MKASWEFERDPLAALRRGDASLFESFVRVETPTFLGFFRRMGASSHEAEDLAQEVLLKLYDHARSYAPRERFAAYAFRIARNAWIDRQRRRASRPGEASLTHPAGDARAPHDGPGAPSLVDGLAARGEDAPSALARSEEASRLRAALAELPEHHRAVFELGVVQELPYAEIALLLDVPVGTVKSRMFHAVRKLRAAVAEAEAAPRASRP